MKAIVIYRQTLLPISETFIKAQASSVSRFEVRFAGLQPAFPSLDLPTKPILYRHTRSSLSRACVRFYNLSGFAPGFHRRLRKANPALIHAHFAPDGASAVTLASSLQVPLMVTLHGYDVTMHDRDMARTFAGRQYLRLRERMLDRASLFICVSEFIRAQAIEKGFPESKLRLHYIGIDRSSFAPSDPPPLKRVLFVGRLVEKKGCVHLLRAMRLVSNSIPSCELVIVGSGPLERSLREQAHSLQLKCTFHGSQPSSTVRQLLADSRILCLPSITAKNGDSEGLGMVLLEAQAMGRPVVGFRTGGIPEAVSDGKTGLLASSGDEKELADHITTFLSDEAFWSKASQQAIDWVAANFDLTAQTQKLERLYQEVIERA